MTNTFRPVCTFVPQLYRKRRQKNNDSSREEVDVPKIEVQTECQYLERGDRRARRVTCEKLKCYLEKESTDDEQVARKGHKNNCDRWVPLSPGSSSDVSENESVKGAKGNCNPKFLNRLRMFKKQGLFVERVTTDSPRKEDKSQDGTLVENTQGIEHVKRARGRPRKNPTTCQRHSACMTDANRSELKSVGGLTTPKRPRGRPRKVKAAASLLTVCDPKNFKDAGKCQMESSSIAKCSSSDCDLITPARDQRDLRGKTVNLRFSTEKRLVTPQNIKIDSFFEHSDDPRSIEYL